MALVLLSGTLLISLEDLQIKQSSVDKQNKTPLDPLFLNQIVTMININLIRTKIIEKEEEMTSIEEKMIEVKDMIDNIIQEIETTIEIILQEDIELATMIIKEAIEKIIAIAILNRLKIIRVADIDLYPGKLHIIKFHHIHHSISSNHQ